MYMCMYIHVHVKLHLQYGSYNNDKERESHTHSQSQVDAQQHSCCEHHQPYQLWYVQNKITHISRTKYSHFT